MLTLLIALAYSYTVFSTGSHSMSLSSSGSQLTFNLPYEDGYNYYIVFLWDPSPIYIDGNSLTSRVYLINYRSASYQISSSSKNKVRFGIFLIPKTYDALEFWIIPASETYSITKSSYSTYYRYFLVIFDSDLFSVTINKNSDSNDIYYSVDGVAPLNHISSATISDQYLVTLYYHQSSSTTANTNYKVSAVSGNSNYNYKYYDNSKSRLSFSNGIYISTFPYPTSGGSFSGGSSGSSYNSLSYGYNSITLYTSEYTKYFIPKNSLVVFTGSDGVDGTANVESYNFDFEDSETRAVVFFDAGYLQLKSQRISSQTVYLVLYNYTNARESCTYVTILSGTVKYKLDPENGNAYCVVSAFTGGNVKISSDDLQHFAVDVEDDVEYSLTTSSKQIYNPIITLTANIYSYNGKIEFDLSGSSSDNDFAIDGSDSKYDFYSISSSRYSKLNTYESVGKASGISGGGLPAWAIILIIIVVVIIVLCVSCTLCCICCCGAKCCCSSTSSSSSYNNERQVETVQEDRSTRVQVNAVPASYYSPPPPTQQPAPQPSPQPTQQQPQQQQAQIPNYTPPPSYNAPPQQPNPYNAPSPQQPIYGAPPQQSVFGAPPEQQPIYGAPPQQAGAYIPPAPAPSYSLPEVKADYDNPYY